MKLLAIDPGVTAGWAYFTESGVLLRCGAASSPRQVTELANLAIYPVQPSEVLIEHPQIYPGGRTKNPNDIVKLAVNAGVWAGHLSARARIEFVYPRSWKGTLNSDVCCARILERLGSGEHDDVYEESTKNIPPSKRHNVIDAIGIGLFRLGRWTKPWQASTVALSL